MGVIGGRLGYQLLRRLGGSPPRRDLCSGAAYRDRSKLEVLLGPGIWRDCADKVVLDFGCGAGDDAVEMAQRGARRVIGLDIRESVLQVARQRAREAGVADRCVFATQAPEPVDVVVSLDGFEHYADPAGALASMKPLLGPGGRVLVAFGPPWFHPLGGHVFSIFPWSHLIFTERALLRWRSDFNGDGATRFSEVAGGLNGMTVRRFSRLVAASGYAVEQFEAVPIRKLSFLVAGPTRELFTAIIRCRLSAA
jgi:SAM-dependent methyltransferase